MTRYIMIYSLIFLILSGCSNPPATEETVNQNVIDETGEEEVKNGSLDMVVDVEVLDRQAKIAITLTNHTNELKKLEFPTSQKYEIIITDENNREVYRFSEGKMFTQAFEYALIKQGESIKWEEIWDYSNQEIAPGKYVVETKITPTNDKELNEKQTIEIINE
jgi:Intracellular proteinase inhibitor